MRLIFDLECDNFLDKVTVIHCIVAKDYDTGEVYSYSPAKIEEGLKLLMNATELIGQNVLDYDLRVIKKLYPKWVTKAKIFDTLIAAKYCFPDIKERDFGRLRKVIAKPVKMRTEEDRMHLRNIGKHSLEAYGLRLGLHKGTFGKDVGFDIFTEEMLEYCKQDVEVTAKLYHKIMSQEPDEKVLELEFKAKQICLEQTSFGFQFDIIKALNFRDKLRKIQNKLQEDINSKLGGPFIIDLGITVPKRNLKYKDVTRGSYTKGCAYSKIKIKEFNPTSRHDLSTRLIERFGWKPRLFGTDGKPTLSEEILDKVDIPVCKTISKLFTIQKRLGMLSDGQNAWLKMYNPETGAIHGNIDTLGTGTHRCTHSRPNLGQIPSTRAAFGKECRELFTVPKGWRLYDTDLSGLELRMLAHYMHAFDEGSYAREVLSGDVHVMNQKAAGLPTRDVAKVFIYAKTYGSGINNLAKVCAVSVKEMKVIVKNFDKNLPALKILTDKVKEASEIRGYVKSLDGRIIPARSSHSALNFLLQSAGAIVAKYWMVYSHEIMKEKGFTHGVEYQQAAYIHDQFDWAFNPELISKELLDEVSTKALKRAEDVLKIKIELGCDSSVGNNFSEVH